MHGGRFFQAALPHGRVRSAVGLRFFLTVGLVWLLASSQAQDEDAQLSRRATTSPFAAHNAYPHRWYGTDRLQRALKAELRFIEVDVTYDAARSNAVVTHDAVPRGGEPALGEFLEPLWAAWADRDDPDLTLIIDLKIGDERLAAAVLDVLRPKAARLTKLLKKPGANLEPGRITVCLTGSADAHKAFDALVPSGEYYLAFADIGYGGADWRSDLGDYVPAEPPGFRRFITLHSQNFMSAADARGSQEISLARLQEVALWAGAAGYRVRVYTVNPGKKPDGSRDTTFWERACEAGVPMISTDDYEESQAWWECRQAPVAAQ